MKQSAPSFQFLLIKNSKEMKDIHKNIGIVLVHTQEKSIGKK